MKRRPTISLSERYLADIPRQAEVDAAVREGVRRTLADGIARWAMESDYAVRAYFRPHILAAWREAHQ